MPARLVLVVLLVPVAGGLGNVAFSLHDGSQGGFALIRFVVGFALVSSWILVAKPVAPKLRSVRNPKVVLHGAAALDALAVVLLILAAGRVDTLVFTVLGVSSPAIVALAVYVLRSPQPGWRAGIAASVCVLGAAGFVLAGNVNNGETYVVGVVLATASMLSYAASIMLSVYAASVYTPARIVRNVCGWGILFASVLVVAGVGIEITRSTVLAATFVAVVPGGLAKAGAVWVYARTSPALVTSLGTISVLSAGVGAWILLGETPTVNQILFGTIVVFAATTVIYASKRVREVAT